MTTPRRQISFFEFICILLLILIATFTAVKAFTPAARGVSPSILRDARPMHGDWVSLAESAAKDYWTHRPGGNWTDACDPGSVTVFSSAIKKRETYGQAVINGCRSFKHPFLVVYPAAEDVGWLYFCSIVVHEYGHLLGHKHDRKHRSDIMYPVIDNFNLQTGVCDRYTPAAGTYLEIPVVPVGKTEAGKNCESSTVSPKSSDRYDMIGKPDERGYERWLLKQSRSSLTE